MRIKGLLEVFFILFLFCYYYLVYINLIREQQTIEFPIFRKRFSTTIWQEKIKQGELGYDNHIYCYYPQGATMFFKKAGEYILKKSESIEQCKEWLGIVIINEPESSSEFDKFMWHDTD